MCADPPAAAVRGADLTAVVAGTVLDLRYGLVEVLLCRWFNPVFKPHGQTQRGLAPGFNWAQAGAGNFIQRHPVGNAALGRCHQII